MSSSADSSSESHLWLRGPSTGAGFSHYVAAVSNRRWMLASAKPQVAVCGFFRSHEQAAAYAAAHQRYKTLPNGLKVPDGPIFMALECGRLFPLALSPQRLFGDQAVHAAKKRDALLRNHYRKREVERAEVAARKAEDERAQGGAAGGKAGASEDPPRVTDPRVRRTASRRARRHAWELLQRLRAQKERIARAASFLRAQEQAGAAAGGAAGAAAGAAATDADDELADFLESLTEAQRRALVADKPAEAGGEAGGAGEPATETVVPRTEINPAPKTKLGSIDEYIAWAERHFARQGIEPASEDMMDREEREREAREVAAAAGLPAGAAGSVRSAVASTPAACPAPAASSASPAASAPMMAHSPSHRLPPPPEGQVFCIGSIFFDDTGARLNKDCPEAAGMEHVVTFFEPAGSAEAARELTEKVYGTSFKDERLCFVRTGVWCCFDNVTDDDGVQLYREDMISEMFSGSAENHMLKFVEKALEQRPDMLPIPTAE